MRWDKLLVSTFLPHCVSFSPEEGSWMDVGLRSLGNETSRHAVHENKLGVLLDFATNVIALNNYSFRSNRFKLNACKLPCNRKARWRQLFCTTHTYTNSGPQPISLSKHLLHDFHHLRYFLRGLKSRSLYGHASAHCSFMQHIVRHGPRKPTEHGISCAVISCGVVVTGCRCTFGACTPDSIPITVIVVAACWSALSDCALRGIPIILALLLQTLIVPLHGAEVD
jgi:hypothetical protein